ncbi:MAG: Spy/CpxP family protein refolding chaperone [Pyrinomonadaceae bacterium]
MNNRIAIAISIALLAVAGTVYTAKGHGSLSELNSTAIVQGEEAFLLNAGEGRHPFARRIMARIAERLGLTDAQKTEIKSIIVAERPAAEPLIRQLVATRKQLRDASSGGNFDEAEVRNLASRQAQTITELIVTRERVKSKIYNVLTPEQRAKADQMRARFESRVREGVEDYTNGQAEK